jgi:DNA-binding protein HU-beta
VLETGRLDRRITPNLSLSLRISDPAFGFPDLGSRVEFAGLRSGSEFAGLAIRHLAGPADQRRSAATGEVALIKLDIINEVVNKTGITKTKAEMAVETVFESMKRSLGRGERIELRGFGIFNVRPRKTGIGRNPRTGAEVAIPPGKAVRFKPGKELQTLQ